MNQLDMAIAAKGLSRTQFAAAVGVSVSTVQGWLRRSAEGTGRLPDGESAKAIELVLSVPDFRKLFPHDWPE